MTHELKCNSDFWPYYKTGAKNSSMRKNDRNYAVGDVLILRLWKDDRFIINEIVVRKITHIVNDFDFKEMPDGYCILSLAMV